MCRSPPRWKGFRFCFVVIHCSVPAHVAWMLRVLARVELNSICFATCGSLLSHDAPFFSPLTSHGDTGVFRSPTHTRYIPHLPRYILRRTEGTGEGVTSLRIFCRPWWPAFVIYWRSVAVFVAKQKYSNVYVDVGRSPCTLPFWSTVGARDGFA